MFLATIYAQNKQSKHIEVVLESVLVDSVWAANMVSFDLYTIKDKQFVVYFNKNRMMTIAVRNIGSSVWEKKILPNQLVWDSHNYVTMGFDEKGYIHISGNMHAIPLTYFRSQKPYDIQSIVALDEMTALEENRVTYPVFFNDSKGQLFFSYRNGGSGSGTTYINQFDSNELRWKRYLDKGLFEGISKDSTRSAYYSVMKDTKGKFHYVWMWRWTPMVETCHQLCYATSSDLIHWKNAFGKDISLPFKPDDKELIVDDVPSKGGLHNGSYKMVFDSNNQPIIGYIKYDEKGLTQLYLAKILNGEWFVKKVSDWDFRWKFKGGGDAMTIGGKFDFVKVLENDLVVIDWKNETGTSGQYILDSNRFENTNKPATIVPNYPDAIYKDSNNPLKLTVNIEDGKTFDTNNSDRYILQWKTDKKSHRKSAPAVIPDGPVSELFVLKIGNK
jgi:hypothetical protein